MKGLSKDSSKEEEELDDMEMTDPFSDLQVTLRFLLNIGCYEFGQKLILNFGYHRLY